VTLGLSRSRPRVGVCVLDTSIGVDREHDEYKRRLSMLIVMDSIQRYFREDGMHQIDQTKEMRYHVGTY
jgi:hypothetical protein